MSIAVIELFEGKVKEGDTWSLLDTDLTGWLDKFRGQGMLELQPPDDPGNEDLLVFKFLSPPAEPRFFQVDLNPNCQTC